MDSQAIRQTDGPAGSMRPPSLLRDWRTLPAILGPAAAMLTSHAVVKISLLLVALTAVVWLVQSRGFLISRWGAVLGGMALFLTAVVVSPYWTIQTLPAGSSAMALGVSVVVGVVWSLCFGRAIAFRGGATPGFAWAIVPAVAVLLLVLPSLSAPLSWRGDEDTHLARLWVLKDALYRIPLNWCIPLLPALMAVALWNPANLARASVRWIVVVGALALLAASMWRVNADGALDDALRRYPFLLVWGQAALSWSVQGWGRAVSSGPECVRLLPLLSLLAMVVWWSSLLHDAAKGAAKGAAEGDSRLGIVRRTVLVAALASVPTLLFYATLGYLELPLILLMIVACCTGDRLLTGHLRGAPVGPAWIALGVIPFLKETALVFVVAVMCAAGLFAVLDGLRGQARPGELLRRYLRLGVVVLAPLAIYLYFRGQGPSVQYNYAFDVTNFAELKLYAVFALALWEQFGVLLVIAGYGLWCAVRSRPRLALFCVMVLIGYFLFFCGNASRRVRVDGSVLVGYLGHSRFVLYLLPPLLALAWAGMSHLLDRRRGWVLAIAVLWLAGNVWMSPLRLDGSRVKGWGDYVIDTQDHQYPYDALYGWLGDQLGGQAATMAVVGRRYSYDIGDEMYAARYALNVAIHAEPLEASAKLRVRESVGPPGTLERAFERAIQRRPDYVVVHEPVWGPQWPAAVNVGGYLLLRTFEFGGSRLFAYAAPTGALSER
ncbi:MAG: hypothetical protein O7D91_04725 [Planctomycetota bacterium]|nr:hypothetical protein [Planctomycetota bacterium]